MKAYIQMERLETKNLMAGLFCPLLTDATPIGDFNLDGYDDLAGVTEHQEVRVYYGSEDGLTDDYLALTDHSFNPENDLSIDHYHNTMVRPGITRQTVWVDRIYHVPGREGNDPDQAPNWINENWYEQNLVFYGESYHDPKYWLDIFGDYHFSVRPKHYDQLPFAGIQDSSDFNGDGVQDLVKTTNFGEVSVVYRRNTERTDRDG